MTQMGFYVIDTAGSLSLLIHTKTLPKLEKIIGIQLVRQWCGIVGRGSC